MQAASFNPVPMLQTFVRHCMHTKAIQDLHHLQKNNKIHLITSAASDLNPLCFQQVQQILFKLNSLFTAILTHFHNIIAHAVYQVPLFVH
jgi:hypothetical protein